MQWSCGEVNTALSNILVNFLSSSGRGNNGHSGEPVLCKRLRLQSTLVIIIIIFFFFQIAFIELEKIRLVHHE